VRLDARTQGLGAEAQMSRFFESQEQGLGAGAFFLPGGKSESGALLSNHFQASRSEWSKVGAWSTLEPFWHKIQLELIKFGALELKFGCKWCNSWLQSTPELKYEQKTFGSGALQH